MLRGGGSVVVDCFFCCSPCLWGLCVCSLLCYAVLSVLSSFGITLMGKREMVALL